MNTLLHIPPPIYALLLLGLCKTLDSLTPLPITVSSPMLGTVLAAAGLTLIIWAWLHFLKNKTTPIPMGEPSALVDKGPYSFTRNPMYLGLLLVLVSVMFFLGSPVYLISPIGFFLITDRLFIPYEEAKLERLFGSDYTKLKYGIRRWL